MGERPYLRKGIWGRFHWCPRLVSYSNGCRGSWIFPETGTIISYFIPFLTGVALTQKAGLPSTPFTITIPLGPQDPPQDSFLSFHANQQKKRAQTQVKNEIFPPKTSPNLKPRLACQFMVCLNHSCLLWK